MCWQYPFTTAVKVDKVCVFIPLQHNSLHPSNTITIQPLEPHFFIILRRPFELHHLHGITISSLYFSLLSPSLSPSKYTNIFKNYHFPLSSSSSLLYFSYPTPITFCDQRLPPYSHLRLQTRWCSSERGKPYTFV